MFVKIKDAAALPLLMFVEKKENLKCENMQTKIKVWGE